MPTRETTPDPARLPSRRVVLAAAAWSAPVVALAAPAPAFAASPPRFTITPSFFTGPLGFQRVRLAFASVPSGVQVTNIVVRLGTTVVSGESATLTTPAPWNESANLVTVSSRDVLTVTFTAGGRNYSGNVTMP